MLLIMLQQYNVHSKVVQRSYAKLNISVQRPSRGGHFCALNDHDSLDDFRSASGSTLAHSCPFMLGIGPIIPHSCSALAHSSWFMVSLGSCMLIHDQHWLIHARSCSALAHSCWFTVSIGSCMIIRDEHWLIHAHSCAAMAHSCSGPSIPHAGAWNVCHWDRTYVPIVFDQPCARVLARPSLLSVTCVTTLAHSCNFLRQYTESVRIVVNPWLTNNLGKFSESDNWDH